MTELFDWIVGTSAGGLLGLGMVYGKPYLYGPHEYIYKVWAYLTLGAHAVHGVSVCVFLLPLYIPALQAIYRPKSDTNGFSRHE